MNPVHEGLFRDDPPALLGIRCGTCGRHSFPVAPDCPLCGAPGPERVALSATGTLWGWTEVTAPPPGYLGTVPFGFGVVELPEGVRIVTRLATPVADYEFGQGVHLRLVELGPRPAADATPDAEPVMTWEFAP